MEIELDLKLGDLMRSIIISIIEEVILPLKSSIIENTLIELMNTKLENYSKKQMI